MDILQLDGAVINLMHFYQVALIIGFLVHKWSCTISYASFATISRIQRNLQLLIQCKARLGLVQPFPKNPRIELDLSKIDFDRDSTVFTVNPTRLLELAKLCETTNHIGRMAPVIDMDKVRKSLADFKYDGQYYGVSTILKRGYNQISGIVLTRHDAVKAQMIISFAGTSSKWDMAHGLYWFNNIFIDESGLHGGATRLAYKNAFFIEDIIRALQSMSLTTEIIFVGHSLGGSIGLITLYLLNKRAGASRNYRGRCITFATPSPFKGDSVDAFIDIIGYNNVLNVIRQADYIHQSAELFGMKCVGPVIHLPNHGNVEWENESTVFQILEDLIDAFKKNHYIEHYIQDLLLAHEDEVWKDHARYIEWYRLKQKMVQLATQIKLDVEALKKE